MTVNVLKVPSMPSEKIAERNGQLGAGGMA
jgi:hypothetical protein